MMVTLTELGTFRDLTEFIRTFACKEENLRTMFSSFHFCSFNISESIVALDL